MRSFTSTASAYLKVSLSNSCAREGIGSLDDESALPILYQNSSVRRQVLFFFFLGFGRRIQAPQAGIGLAIPPAVAGHVRAKMRPRRKGEQRTSYCITLITKLLTTSCRTSGCSF